MGRRRLSAVLPDGRAWVWALFSLEKLSTKAAEAIAAAGVAFVWPLNLFAAAQKVRIGK